MDAENLRQNTFSGVLWNSFGQLTGQLFSFVFGIVLARNIIPSDYGVFAIALVAINFSSIIIDNGITLSLIRDKNANEKDYSTAFYIFLTLSCFLYSVYIFLAPLAARYFEMPMLKETLIITGSTIIINVIGSISYIKLNKKLSFRNIVLSQIIPLTISGTVAVYLVKNGWGLYSIITQVVLFSLLKMILLLIFEPWFPKFLLSKTSLAKVYSTSLYLFLSNLINSIFESFYSIYIGKKYSSSELAFYNRADSYQGIVSKSLSGMIQGVALPSLSSIQEDKNRLKHAVVNMVSTVLFINTPIMLGLIAVAPLLIRFLLTEIWIEAAYYLQILCLIGLFYPLHVICINVLIILGKTKKVFHIELLKKSIIIVVIIFAFNKDITVLLWGLVASNIIHYGININAAFKHINYPIIEHLLHIIPYFGISGFMALIVLFIGKILEATTLTLVLQISAGIFIYFFLAILFKPKGFSNFKEIIISAKRK